MERFEKCSYIEELDRDTVCELIDFIWVFRKEKVGKGYRQKIGVHYNFIGELNGCDILECFDHITKYKKHKTRLRYSLVYTHLSAEIIWRREKPYKQGTQNGIAVI